MFVSVTIVISLLFLRFYHFFANISNEFFVRHIDIFVRHSLRISVHKYFLFLGRFGGEEEERGNQQPHLTNLTRRNFFHFDKTETIQAQPTPSVRTAKTSLYLTETNGIYRFVNRQRNGLVIFFTIILFSSQPLIITETHSLNVP